MAMQVGNSGGEQAPLNSINTTPLVDVMLVLLIIFLITVPVVMIVSKCARRLTIDVARLPRDCRSRS